MMILRIRLQPRIVSLVLSFKPAGLPSLPPPVRSRVQRVLQILPLRYLSPFAHGTSAPHRISIASLHACLHISLTHLYNSSKRTPDGRRPLHLPRAPPCPRASHIADCLTPSCAATCPRHPASQALPAPSVPTILRSSLDVPRLETCGGAFPGQLCGVGALFLLLTDRQAIPAARPGGRTGGRGASCAGAGGGGTGESGEDADDVHGADGGF